MVQKINTRWIQRFMHASNIVFRCQIGKLMVSEARRCHIDKQIADHFGIVVRGLSSGDVDEAMYENADKRHFIVNMDNGCPVGFRGDEIVKYSDVFCGWQGMTMVVRVTGGVRAIIEVPFMIFQNEKSSYPIRGVQDNTLGLCYRSSKKGLMTNEVWAEWLAEPRAQRTEDQNNRTRHTWCDNVSSHAKTENFTSTATRLNVKLRKFVACATDLIQQADSFVISKNYGYLVCSMGKV